MSDAESRLPDTLGQPEVADPSSDGGSRSGPEVASRIAWIATEYSGPIPSAEELAAYHEIDPTLVDRIIRLSEDEADHRRRLEARSLDQSIRATRRGQVFGTLIAMAALGTSVSFVALGADPYVIVVILAAVGTIVTTILLGNRRDARKSSEGDEDLSDEQGDDSKAMAD